MKASGSKKNVGEASARELFARAAAAEEQAKAARKDARSAKAKYKDARKAYKLAKRDAKTARREAKAAAESLQAQVLKRAETGKRPKQKAQPGREERRSTGTRLSSKNRVKRASARKPALAATAQAKPQSIVIQSADAGSQPPVNPSVD